MDEKASGDVYNGRYDFRRTLPPPKRPRRPISGSRLTSLLSGAPRHGPRTPLT
ncbi:Putative MhmaT1 transposase [Caligus rogercresseyi]|uniref:MhmaT1 transposase n=1 Tax=Caligus rogercresseyi TaxID=217165 RepID=A0A7T8QWX1_CALRO|nr:Putative MhmaT1 transposase [Caligus rogercresseyi]